ncbi:uncharacterized protein LOC126672731 [Mercurialis annua]|uniref:uncharacterized protein LOC126672731 n=1 Tax=Mercurialis annua TaxID=3986 RepID=UPI00215DD84E|nr:uncharacterized protein LOC126672731 [Mercurialis annua]
MKEDRSLKHHMLPSLDGATTRIARPHVEANNFEVKPAFIQMITHNLSFNGLPSDDPYEHITNFLELCNTFKMNRFLEKYYPTLKTAKLCMAITTFAQQDLESLPEAWEQFNEYLRKCPHHGVPGWLVVETFFNGLNGATRMMLDAASGGSFREKEPNQCNDLIETMAANNYERSLIHKPVRDHEIETISALDAEGSNYVDNQERGQNNSYYNTYNPEWKNHPNLSWSNTQNAVRLPPGFQPQEPRKPSLEDILIQHMQKTDSLLQNQQAFIKGLENKIGHIANLVATRAQGTLPRNTEVNPKEQVMEITLIRGSDFKWASIKFQEGEVDVLAKPVKEEKVVELKPYVPKLPYL